MTLEDAVACIRLAGQSGEDAPQWVIEALVHAFTYGHAIGKMDAFREANAAIVDLKDDESSRLHLLIRSRK